MSLTAAATRRRFAAILRSPGHQPPQPYRVDAAGWPGNGADMRIAAILVAAGSGSRFGAETPKQFLPLLGKLVIRHAAEALAEHVHLLLPVGDASAIEAALTGIAHLPPVAGGATRQDSVHAGLEALLPQAPDIVLVHDAARPLIPPAPSLPCWPRLNHAPGAIPAVPVADTLKRVTATMITATVPRDGLFRAQTPQAFRFAALLAAHHASSGPRPPTMHRCWRPWAGRSPSFPAPRTISS